jgi:ribokinase
VQPRIVVVGSFVMDLVVWAERRPARGETLLGQRFGMFPGGKGFNQAVAAARMGARVTMVGRLRSDSFAEPFREMLDAEGIDARWVVRDREEGTGIATPLVEANGENSIVIVPRANGRLSEGDIEAARPALESCDALLLQCEVPTVTSLHAAQIAQAAGARVILNPAPVVPIPAEMWEVIDLLVPNEVEAAVLSGSAEDDPLGAATALLRRGLEAVVVTLGAKGALLVGHQGSEAVAAHTVPVVDSVAAGDAFCGALAATLAGGTNLREAVQWANAAGALAVTLVGAAPSMPRRALVGGMLRTGWREEESA